MVWFDLLAVAAPLGAQECLDVIAADPSGAVVPNATVSGAGSEQRTDNSGTATIGGLDDGPRSMVVVAPASKHAN